jgi:hypothetical protein
MPAMLPAVDSASVMTGTSSTATADRTMPAARCCIDATKSTGGSETRTAKPRTIIATHGPLTRPMA